LSGANLTDAHLAYTNFTGANLIGANLTGAIFSKTNFSAANMIGVTGGLEILSARQQGRLKIWSDTTDPYSIVKNIIYDNKTNWGTEGSKP
jgi:uncharacterized protein YjbI with pentapeptide repeats